MEQSTTPDTTKITKSRYSTLAGMDSATARDTPPRRPAIVETTRPRWVVRRVRCFSLRSSSRIVKMETCKNT
ncbi:Uncharacterised protein [Mycobacterium tuberculosis]|nr:Uncharacterised protein [Mycobacterium tuberculosis]